MNVAEVPVRWQLEGGKPPYQLEIDGETRDAQHEYIGTSGTASVSCALRLGEVTYNESPARDFRRFKGDVLVDSGSKLIRATVTDATGRTNTAEISMYVILVFVGTGRSLTEGQTYRIWGQLITIPVGDSARVGGISISECSDDDACEAPFDSGLIRLFTQAPPASLVASPKHVFAGHQCAVAERRYLAQQV